MTKRPIAPLALEGLAPAAPPTGRPEITWIAPGELLVDAVYQRDLSDASRRLIRRIVEGWDWRRFKPPIAAWTEEGLEVIDGQHSAIAAATHPAIIEIPVVVVDAAERTDRASAFLGHNRDRIAISTAQMHAAAVAAGDEAAARVERVCAAAEIRLLRMPPSGAQYKARETIAVAMVAGLVKRRGEATAVQVLRILGDAGCAPVAASQMRAVEALLTEAEFGDLDPEALARTIQDLGAVPAEKEAKAFAATHCTPLWRGLAAVWFKAGKKRRRPAAGIPAAAAPAVVPAVAERALLQDPTSEPKSQQASAPSHAPRAVIVERTNRAAPRPISLARVVLGEETSAPRAAPARRQRPALGGWKPGDISKRCVSCEEVFEGALTATECELCAYGSGAAA